jgi:GT2 family glycosyltransferase
MDTPVSIIILGYNSKKYLKWCLDAVFSQSYPNLEIIYVDNDSDDGSLEFVEQNYCSKIIKTKEQKNKRTIKIIRNNKNFGYAGGQNIGIKNSSGEFILCLNPDIILDKDYIKNIITLFSKNSKIGAATGKLFKFKLKDVYTDNLFQLSRTLGQKSDNNLIIEKTNIIDSCGLKIFKSHRVIERGGGKINNEQYRQQEQIFGVSGAAPIFKKIALEKIKFNEQYFDEDFFAYKEDIDISFRLLHSGFESWFEPKAKGWHHRWETGTKEKEKFSNLLKRRGQRRKIINYLSYRNHLCFLFKNEFLSNLILYSPWIFAYEFKKLAFGLFLDKYLLYGFWDFLKTLALTLGKRNAILSKSKIKPLDIQRWLK